VVVRLVLRSRTQSVEIRLCSGLGDERRYYYFRDEINVGYGDLLETECLIRLMTDLEWNSESSLDTDPQADLESEKVRDPVTMSESEFL
jgi:hypothetical protein